MRRLLFWLCLPLVIPQALWVRRTAPRFADAAGPSQGQTGTGDPQTLLAVGDSIIAGVGADTLEQALVGQTALALSKVFNNRIAWHAVGTTGATSSRLIKDQLPALPSVSADFI